MRLSKVMRPIGIESSSTASSATQRHADQPRRRISTRRRRAQLATSAIASTDAIASEADDQVDPHNSANWMIDFVSSSMKPGAEQEELPRPRARLAAASVATPRTAITETTRTSASTAT